MRRSKIALLIGFALWLAAAEAQGQIQPQPVFQAKGSAVKIRDETAAYTNYGPFDVTGHSELTVIAVDCPSTAYIRIRGGMTPALASGTTESADGTMTLDKDTNAMAFTMPIVYPYISFAVTGLLGGSCKIWVQPLPFNTGTVRGPVKDGRKAPGDGYTQARPYPVIVGGWDGTNVHTFLTDAAGALFLSTAMLGVNTSANSSSANGEVLVTTAITLVPTNPLQSRRAIEIQNRGPNSIFCTVDGSSPAVNGGREIKTAASWSLDCSDVACTPICITSVNQIAGAATWVTELE
jgi:muconolactone delta-isomerase